MSEWILVDERLPEPYKTVLVQHKDDLAPVSAFLMFDHWSDPDEAENIWFYDSDGSEDMDPPPKHRNTPLLRPPTHWMPLPKPPQNEGEG